jgi:hypothetical protein
MFAIYSPQVANRFFGAPNAAQLFFSRQSAVSVV